MVNKETFVTLISFFLSCSVLRRYLKLSQIENSIHALHFIAAQCNSDPQKMVKNPVEISLKIKISDTKSLWAENCIDLIFLCA